MSVDKIAETACAGVGPYDARVADQVYAVLLRHGGASAALDSDVHKCIARALAASEWDGTWFPGRWWQAIDAEGDLWCETSDEEDVRSMARPTDRIRRLWHQERREWRIEREPTK